MADVPTKTVDEDHTKHDTQEVPSLDHAPKGVLEDGALDPVYAAKARVLNKAIQDIGMGKYQVVNPSQQFDGLIITLHSGSSLLL